MSEENECNQRREWNPFGWYTDGYKSIDEIAELEKEKKQKKDALTRFIDSCSTDSNRREVYDRTTGKYVPYSPGQHHSREKTPKNDDLDPMFYGGKL